MNEVRALPRGILRPVKGLGMTEGIDPLSLHGAESSLLSFRGAAEPRRWNPMNEIRPPRNGGTAKKHHSHASGVFLSFSFNDSRRRFCSSRRTACSFFPLPNTRSPTSFFPPCFRSRDKSPLPRAILPAPRTPFRTPNIYIAIPAFQSLPFLCRWRGCLGRRVLILMLLVARTMSTAETAVIAALIDRKSTRLNSSH